jgi:GTP pyrophosphokinase
MDSGAPHVTLTERFRDAMSYAFELHQAQRRKGSGAPYVGHLLGVCSLVLEHGGTEDEAIAALLHDAIEDQGGEVVRRELRSRFGDTVTAIVEGCSDTDIEPKPPWRARKEAYLAHLPHAEPSVLLVSAADKVHNLQSILRDYRELGEALWSRFRGGREGTLWYYRSLAAVFLETGPLRLAEEIQRLLEDLEALADPSR